jgi:hypothetical protein
MPVVLDTMDATFGSNWSAAKADKGVNAIVAPIPATAARNSRREQLESILMALQAKKRPTVRHDKPVRER